MPSYAIDSDRQPMTATGIVAPVQEWVETADGSRRPSDTQARDELTGMPLWAVEVLYVQSSYGRESTCTARVTVGAEHEPKPARMSDITFTGLTAELRVNKAKALVENWSAEAIAQMTEQGQPRAVDKPAGDKPVAGKAGDKSTDKAVA